MQENDVLRVLVTALYPYGIDVRYGDRVGFVQQIELSWGRVADPSDVVRVGDELDVKVYGIGPEKFYASVRRVRPELNPWAHPEQFAVGTRHRGVVTAIYPAGGVDVQVHEFVSGQIARGEFPGAYDLGQLIDVEVVAVSAEFKMVQLRPCLG